jgi:hypothetical protein
VRFALRFSPVLLVGVAAAVYGLSRAQPMRPDDRGLNQRHAAAAPAPDDNPRGPSATCSGPLPDSASPADCARGVVTAGACVAANLDAVFARWQAVSAEFEPVGDHERRRLVALHHPAWSAHELDLVCELRGPIDAESLAHRYTWESPVGEATHIRLAAESHDAVERLFFRRFTVTLERETCRPVSVQFTDGAGQASSLPFPLETTLSLEARLARAVRDPDQFQGTVVPAGHDTAHWPPAPHDLPSSAERIRPLP